MKVFISWSGDRSKEIAEELRDWLPTIVQSLEPFISTQDVPVGERGLNVLASQLQDCSFGILCLTQENKQGQWIHFEAGALSKVIDASRVVPLLLDLKISDLTGPLVQFQAISIEDRDGVFSLIKALAEQSIPPIAENRLQRLFDAFWPGLEAKVSELKVAVASEPKQNARSEREILEEILLISRNTEREMSNVIIQKMDTPSLRTTGSPKPMIGVIQDKWGEILDAVKRERRVAWILLSSVTPKSLTEDMLTIEFARGKDIKGFLSSGCDADLSRVLHAKFGVLYRIACIAGPNSSPATEAEANKDLTGMDLIERELGRMMTGEPPSSYSGEPPF
jgi:TIR domain